MLDADESALALAHALVSILTGYLAIASAMYIVRHARMSA
jgi:hypothetical protein